MRIITERIEQLTFNIPGSIDTEWALQLWRNAASICEYNQPDYQNISSQIALPQLRGKQSDFADRLFDRRAQQEFSGLHINLAFGDLAVATTTEKIHHKLSEPNIAQTRLAEQLRRRLVNPTVGNELLFIPIVAVHFVPEN